MSSKKSSKELLKMESCLVSKAEHLKRLLTNTKPATSGNTFRLENSSVLDKVKGFLPEIKQANCEVEKAIENGDDVDIENIDENYDGKLIEMDFALFPNGDDSSEDECDNHLASSSDDDSIDNEISNKKPLVMEYKPEGDEINKK
ncbi:hypothetical protein CHUAL_004949 [Chamberlinius hualienensis]